MCCDKGKRGVPLVQQKLLTFITAHEFTQPCSILSLNSSTMGAPSAAETSSLYHSTWLIELMCSDKGKKFMLH
jgi:hypothetical protein